MCASTDTHTRSKADWWGGEESIARQHGDANFASLGDVTQRQGWLLIQLRIHRSNGCPPPTLRGTMERNRSPAEVVLQPEAEVGGPQDARRPGPWATKTGVPLSGGRPDWSEQPRGGHRLHECI